MAFAIWQGFIRDGNGQPVPGAFVECISEVSGLPVLLYSDRDGEDLAGNPVTADSSGYAFFFVEGGAYRIRAYLGTFERIFRYVAIGRGAEVDDNGAGTYALTFVLDGGGAPISTGVKGDLPVPFDFTLEEVTLLADQTGSIVIDIWKDTYANFPPTVADTIVAAAKPTITTNVKSQDTVLQGWDVQIEADSILRFNVDSISTITRCTISLKGRKGS